MGVFKYSPADFLFTCLGLVFLLLDIGLDVWAVVTFYQDGAYTQLCFLLLFLLGSSALVQAFSWLWYSYDGCRRETRVERYLSRRQLKVLHALQLGIYLRHAGVVEISVRSFFTKTHSVHEDVAVYLSHDLSLLRLIETFSESAPQLTLMLTIILQRGQLDPLTVMKAIGSASAITFCVTMYHRALRSFLPDKAKQRMPSSVFFFLWNLLLIASRLAALALFASVLPCFIVPHFFCSWVLLFFFVWRAQTDLMSSACGEWLYRATVGLIWYFNWFNVAEGRTRYRTLFYHSYMLADISLLCSLWCWKMTSTEHTYFKIPNPYAMITAASVGGVYILGLFLKVIYYNYCHPNLAKEELKGDTGLGPMRINTSLEDSVDSAVISPEDQNALNGNSRPMLLFKGITDDSRPVPPAPDTQRCNKRMRKHAENFYS